MKHLLTIILLSCFTCSYAQLKEEAVLINQRSFLLKQIHIVPETYSVQTLTGTDLLTVHPYYGEQDKQGRGLVMSFVHSGKYAFVKTSSKQNDITELVKELNKYKLLRDTVIDTNEEVLFLKEHPVPKGYLPPEEFRNY